jgi:signal transduction histidine kinase
LSMNERALMLGGTLEVTSGRGAGTKIVVRVPYADREDERLQP